MARPAIVLLAALSTGCLADWRPPAAEGWTHERWFPWRPADAAHPGGPGQAWAWTVPDAVDRISVAAWGAGGGGSVAPPRDRVGLGFAGGPGGFTLAELAVTPGEVLLVVPGRGGASGGATGAGTWSAPPPGQRWLGGGGPGAPVTAPVLPGAVEDEDGCAPVDPGAAARCTGAGAGGGFSGVFAGDGLDAILPTKALVVAGGGGGGGAGGPGGAGGGLRGGDAPDCGPSEGAAPGLGGWADAPGVGGGRSVVLEREGLPGGFGGALVGGSGGHANPHMGVAFGDPGMRGGGGGGGGWFGGSGGRSFLPGVAGCGGGGGSGHARGLVESLPGLAPDRPPPEGPPSGTGGPPGTAGAHGGVRIRW